MVAIIVFIQTFIYTFLEFLYAPFLFPDMLWILLPVVLAIGLMELYFHKYPRLGIGHHHSLEGSIFLLFISIDLMRHIFTVSYSMQKLVVASFIIAAWAVFGYMDFRHRLPRTFIFKHSSKFVIAYSSYIALVLIYTDILNAGSMMHNVSVFLSVIILFSLIFVLKRIILFFEPKTYEEIEHFLKKIENDIERSSRNADAIVNSKKK